MTICLIKTASAIVALGLLAGGCADSPDPDMTDPRPRPVSSTPTTDVVAGERMTSAQISRRLVGRELVARNLDTGTVNVVWLTPDKRVKWVKGDRITFGAWRVSGNELCFRYDDPARGESCAQVYSQGPRRFVSVRDGKPVTRIEIEK